MSGSVVPALSPERRSPAVGIIDIGSNSVRLVVYSGLVRAPVPIFNEKVLCGLGRTIASSGKLDEKGVERAVNALKRFRALLTRIGVEHVEAVATAAVRDASNGSVFLETARRAIAHDVHVLSGKEEAHLAAEGVLAGTPEAKGVVGDLGGGSLELVEVADGKIGNGATLPLGALRLMDLAGEDLSKAAKIADEALNDLDWMADHKDDDFYVVGGTWRNLARLHMAQTGYPIRVLHHYTVPCGEARELSRVLSKLSRKSLERIPEISKRRIEALPYGAIVLNAVLKKIKARDVVVSAYGLREGLLHARIGEEERAKDPLLEGCRDLADRLARYPSYGAELKEWTDALFGEGALKENAEQERLRHAACLIADIAWYVHPDYRAQNAMNQILLAPISGIDHPGRLFLARVGFHRHEGDEDPAIYGNLEPLLDVEGQGRAAIIGLAFRLAFTLCAATPDILPRTRLALDGETLRLVMPKALGMLSGEIVEKRLQQLGRALDREAAIDVRG